MIILNYTMFQKSYRCAYGDGWSSYWGWIGLNSWRVNVSTYSHAAFSEVWHWICSSPKDDEPERILWMEKEKEIEEKISDVMAFHDSTIGFWSSLWCCEWRGRRRKWRRDSVCKRRTDRTSSRIARPSLSLASWPPTVTAGDEDDLGEVDEDSKQIARAESTMSGYVKEWRKQFR